MASIFWAKNPAKPVITFSLSSPSLEVQIIGQGKRLRKNRLRNVNLFPKIYQNQILKNR